LLRIDTKVGAYEQDDQATDAADGDSSATDYASILDIAAFFLAFPFHKPPH
jgi:hypothetical protein